MEDDLKLLKVEYLSNRLLDHAQILNLSFHDHTILYIVKNYHSVMLPGYAARECIFILWTEEKLLFILNIF